MKPRDFFSFASHLFVAFPGSAASFRSVISRAYYGVYHRTTELIAQELGIRCRSGISEHLYLQRLLKESGVDEAVEIGQMLDNLHNSRKQADYELENSRPEQQLQAKICLERAVEIISRLDAVSQDESLKQRIANGINDYKRKVNDLP